MSLPFISNYFSTLGKGFLCSTRHFEGCCQPFSLYSYFISLYWWLAQSSYDFWSTVFLAHLTPDNFRSEWWTPGQRQVPAGSVPCSLGWREWPWQRAHCRWKGKNVNTTFRKSRTTFRKMGRLIHCLNTFVDFYWILIIEIYSRVNFVYHLWECTSIFRPLF